MTKDKFAYADVDLEKGKWHEAHILIRGDLMTAWINAEEVGQLRSEGIGHETKQNIAFAVGGKAEVDSIQIWSLD